MYFFLYLGRSPVWKMVRQTFCWGVQFLPSNNQVCKKKSPNIEIEFKGNAQLIFLCNSQKSSVNVCFIKILKSTVTKKVIVCFYNLGEENFLKLQILQYFQLPQWFCLKSVKGSQVTFWMNCAFPLTRIFGFQLAALALKMNHSVTHYVIKISRKIPLNELNELIL